MEGKNGKPEKAYDRVLNYIKSEIYQGILKRGDALPPERDLAEKLGVSRNSVREALRTMSLMGFISSVQGAGNFVSCDLEKNLSETFQMMMMMGETNFLQVSQLRRGLEGETAKLAASRITSGQVTKLAALARQMDEEMDPQKGSLLDRKFHYLLCEAAGNKLIRSLFGAMLTTFNEFISTMYVRICQTPGEGSQLNACHWDIVRALEAHDEEAAICAIGRHFDVVDRAVP